MKTPTALLNREPRKPQLVAPFYDIFAYSKYSLVDGHSVKTYNGRMHIQRSCGATNQEEQHKDGINVRRRLIESVQSQEPK